MALRNYPINVKELIEMLERWQPHQEFEVLVNPSPGEPTPIVVLMQNNNTIRLN